jgi:hypothetical protein
MRPTQPAQHGRHIHPRDHRARRGRGGAASPGSLSDKVRRERRCKHRGSQGRAPDKEATVGAYPSDAAAVRCGGGGSMAVFEVVEALWWSAAVG